MPSDVAIARDARMRYAAERAARDPERLARAVRVVRAGLNLDDWAERLAAAAPPLTPDQIAELRRVITAPSAGDGAE